ncbi:hypothetical protein K505DRAFT_87844 [Melanomma pulvis-pyrius CBS 109.77]|uniref:Uncharacterized protein n=1 Tax=Melanomma pulvis-pyrius CBS 109.77 TaxID=1314802 RepID=A0A6A6XRB9_9PLEO|nr:hypothetical protein K505DRAFT_87844 [Melanomma pulvis-pyrius CBS 109.77]
MEKRHSSPSTRAFDQRPKTQRKRSSSFPMVDALGCSMAEAELIMAEGRAAVRSRHASANRRSRRRPSPRDEDEVYHPRDHIKYLNHDLAVFQDVDEEPVSPSTATNTRHTRIPSNATDVTVIGPDQPHVEDPHATDAPGSPLEDYSATLAKFIQSQLNSIPSYQTAHASVYPRSCPDLSPRLRTPPQSPTKPSKRPIGVHSIVEIPPIRPPLISAFSAWSSTDDETDEVDDDVPPLPEIDASSRNESRASNYTPSILSFYENSNESSFLFTSTPLDEEDPLTARGFSFPDQSTLPGTTSPHSPAQHKDDYPSSTLSTHPQLSSSSAPSFSSISTASYFDCKQPLSLAPHVRARIIAAVTPNHNGKIITAISPFEGGTLTNVHDILVESQHRVLVDGLSFDMLRDFSMPEEGMKEGMTRVPTPC